MAKFILFLILKIFLIYFLAYADGNDKKIFHRITGSVECDQAIEFAKQCKTLTSCLGFRIIAVGVEFLKETMDILSENLDNCYLTEGSRYYSKGISFFLLESVTFRQYVVDNFPPLEDFQAVGMLTIALKSVVLNFNKGIDVLRKYWNLQKQEFQLYIECDGTTMINLSCKFDSDELICGGDVIDFDENEEDVDDYWDIDALCAYTPTETFAIFISLKG